MNKEFVFSISNSSNVADIRIIGDIGYWSNNSAEFTRLIDNAIAAGIKDVNVYVNSYGGSVFEANEIGNQISRFSGAKNVKLGAIAASAAGYLTCYFDQVTASKNTQFMVHDVIMQPTILHEEDFESSRQLYLNLSSNIISLFAAKTSLSEDEIKQMMKATTWMNATTAKEKGFVDQIESSESDLPENIAIDSIKNMPTTLITAIQNHVKINDMSKTYAALGLPANATDEQAESLILALKKTATNAIVALATAKGVKDASVIENSANQSPEITFNMVNAMTSVNSETTENNPEEKPETKNALVSALENVLKGSGIPKETTRKLDDYTPVELENMAEKEPAKYEALINSTYKK